MQVLRQQQLRVSRSPRRSVCLWCGVGGQGQEGDRYAGRAGAEAGAGPGPEGQGRRPDLFF